MNQFTKHCLDRMMANPDMKFANVDEVMYEFEDSFSGDAEAYWNETAVELGDEL